MTLLRLAACSLVCVAVAKSVPGSQSAAEVTSELRQISIDENKIYRVRDLVLKRGDIKLYLNEGLFGFFKPVGGHTVAAVFTTEQTELGDAEAILLPPQRSERASLASFTKLPNLDEHFVSTLLIFSDDTAKEVLEQINQTPLRPAAELGEGMARSANPICREMVRELEVRLVAALLDNHPANAGFFYAVVGGKTLGTFDLMYDPTQAESVTAGAMRAEAAQGGQRFETWTSFQPRHTALPEPPAIRAKDYKIETEIRPDLSLSARAAFRLQGNATDGRVVALELSPRLKVDSATIDGRPAEIVQRETARPNTFGGTQLVALVAGTALTAGMEHAVSVHYQGSVIRKTSGGDYFVDDRNSWYPVIGFVLADFDLTFHCAEHLRLVSTGELVSDSVKDGIRTVHRKTTVPEGLAGFNLGVYNVRREQHGPYEIEVYSQQTVADLSSDPDLPARIAAILSDYTKWWIPLSIHSLAVSPIAGYFGQGFPGLIYLSSVSYMKQENRPVELRNARMDAFFSDLLLPHEVAHQWWGNIVRSVDYRSSWLNEAMANDSALEYLKGVKGAGAKDDVLDGFRKDLVSAKDGKRMESAGPVDFGERLIDTHGMLTWHVITYEKGTWILEMLRQRLGAENYRTLQLRLLREYAAKPVSNESFRELASSLVPAGQPDRSLSAFFDTWIYGTGIPRLGLRRSGRTVSLERSDVEEDFIVDVPLRCRTAGGGETTHWVRAGFGSNQVELPASIASCELPSPHAFLYLH